MTNLVARTSCCVTGAFGNHAEFKLIRFGQPSIGSWVSISTGCQALTTEDRLQHQYRFKHSASASKPISDAPIFNI